MWPYLIGAGLVALLAKIFSEEGGTPKRKSSNRKTSSNHANKNIFVSFAIEDKKYRDFLVAQAKNERSPFSFFDMSVKAPWEQQVF